MLNNSDVLRRLKNAGLRPGGPSPEAAALDADERDLIGRIASSNDAQVAMAKQQLRFNQQTFDANLRSQEIAQAQWTLVFTADLYKFLVERGGDTALKKAAEARLLEFLGPAEEGPKAYVPREPQAYEPEPEPVEQEVSGWHGGPNAE